MPTSRSAKSGPPSDSEKAGGLSKLDSEVRAVLAEFPTAAAAPRFELLTGQGGLSGARIWRVDAGIARFALRQWPVEHPSPERLQFIHAVLEHVGSKGFRIAPIPIHTCRGDSYVAFHGRLWELAPWLPGEANFELEASPEKRAAAMRALAQFHLASASFRDRESTIGSTQLLGISPGITDRARRLNGLDSAEIHSLLSAMDGYSISESINRLARTILTYLAPAAAAARPILEPATSLNLPLQPCLRDIWHGNLLFTGDEVTGIVDFGAMQLDSPALDVARLLGSMAGDDLDAWRNGLAAYEAIRPLTAGELLTVRAADASGIVLGCTNWLRWLYVERRRFGDLPAVEMRINKLLPRLLNMATPPGIADPHH